MSQCLESGHSVHQSMQSACTHQSTACSTQLPHLTFSFEKKLLDPTVQNWVTENFRLYSIIWQKAGISPGLGSVRGCNGQTSRNEISNTRLAHGASRVTKEERNRKSNGKKEKEKIGGKASYFSTVLLESRSATVYRFKETVNTYNDSKEQHCSIYWHILAFWWILSICLFCPSISLPMSTAMLRRLPIMFDTSPTFCSISSSRASFVILPNNRLQVYTQHPRFITAL